MMTDDELTEWYVILQPERYPNGRLRTWTGFALDWDEAGELAEAANPGWTAHTIGLRVEGAHI